MKVTRLSSTELKRNTAKVLNLVAFGDTVAVVERHGKPLVMITSAASPVAKDSGLEEKLENYFGALPDFPSVSKTRHFRRKRLNL